MAEKFKLRHRAVVGRLHKHIYINSLLMEFYIFHIFYITYIRCSWVCTQQHLSLDDFYDKYVFYSITDSSRQWQAAEGNVACINIFTFIRCSWASIPPITQMWKKEKKAWGGKFTTSKVKHLSKKNYKDVENGMAIFVLF